MRAGAQVDVAASTAWTHGEPRGTVRVRAGGLRPLVIGPDEVPGLIDELPALAALATHGGELHVTGAAELRVKESDRISALVAGLRALGRDADELPTAFTCAAAGALTGGDRSMPPATIVWRWRLPIAALGAERPCRSSRARMRSTFRTRVSSTTSSGADR